MVIWLVAAAVVVVAGFALAWWSSGRAKPALDLEKNRSRRRQVEGEVNSWRPDAGTPKGGVF